MLDKKQICVENAQNIVLDTKYVNALELGKQVIEQEALALQHLATTIGEDFQCALHAIVTCEGRLIITGMGKSGHIAKKIAATMSSVGTPSFFLHPSEASHGDLGTVTTKDIVLALSNSGESKELFDVLRFTARYNIKLIAITKNKESSLGKQADICLTLPNELEACPIGCAPTSSTTMSLALGDALAMALLDLRGFNAEDFHAFHPGGKLGSSLVRIEKIMHTKESLPISYSGTKMSDALMEMTQKGFGCLAILQDDKDSTLLGIIADGDLRRHMSANLLTQKVDDIMTKNPTTITKDVLASKAIHIMNKKSITNLMVLDEENKLIGLVHMHDCLRVGV